MDFQIWNNNDQGGLNDVFTGAQGQGNITANTDSLETYDSTWVIIFNDTNYTGDFKKIGPNTYLSDLNHEDRYNTDGDKQGDWKNQIKSFILYKQEPSFWGSSSRATNDELLQVHSGGALFASDTNFKGDNHTFYADYNAGNLQLNDHYTTNGNPMWQSITSLKTGDNAWLLVFNNLDWQGDYSKYGPNTKFTDLNSIPRYNSYQEKTGDWKHQIQSFILYSSKPDFWDTHYPRAWFVPSDLQHLFPAAYVTGDDGNDRFSYEIADNTYLIYYPEFKTQDFQTSTYHIHLEHNNAGHNDKAEFDMVFGNDGVLQQINNFTWQSGGALLIPQQAITIVDDMMWVLGTAGAIESLGISEEAADEFNKTFDFVCNVFNKVSSLIYNKTDSGGLYYFLPVVCHAINRMCTHALSHYTVNTFINQNDSRKNGQFNFNYNGFLDSLRESSNVSLRSNWVAKAGFENNRTPFNEVIEYSYEGFNYRTWYQEVSYSTELGMFVSCKIDYEIGSNTKDDHLVILLGFKIPAQGSSIPVLNFAHATLQFTSDSDTSKNINTTPCTSGNIIDSVCQQLSDGIKNASTTGSYTGRLHLSDIAQFNMNAISASVEYLP